MTRAPLRKQLDPSVVAFHRKCAFCCLQVCKYPSSSGLENSGLLSKGGMKSLCCRKRDRCCHLSLASGRRPLSRRMGTAAVSTPSKAEAQAKDR